jgi:hypothetical protein
MATVANANNACVQNTSRRLYIATGPFDTYFYSYNGKVLSIVPEASCETCPAGRVLRENGRKLYPGANPGVFHYMVGVYDSVTFLSGFINPNDDVFAVYNSDKPTYMPDIGDEYSSDGEADDAANFYGPPVLTSGNVLSSDGFVGIQSTIQAATTYAGSYLYAIDYERPGRYFETVPIVEAGVQFNKECTEPGEVPFTYATLYPDGMIQSITFTDPESFPSTVTLTADGNTFNTGNTSTMGNLFVQGDILNNGNTSTLGDLFVQGDILNNGNVSTLGTVSYATGLRVPEPSLGGAVNMVAGTDDGTYRRLTVSASGCRAFSRVLLTYGSFGNPGLLCAEAVTNGSFQIVSSSRNDISDVNYFIFN